jgi:hypothetical protein
LDAQGARNLKFKVEKQERGCFANNERINDTSKCGGVEQEQNEAEKRSHSWKKFRINVSIFHSNSTRRTFAIQFAYFTLS